MTKFILVVAFLVTVGCEDRPHNRWSLCQDYCAHIARWAEACNKPPISIAACERAVDRNTRSYGECWEMHVEWQPNAEDDCSRIPRFRPTQYVREPREKQ